MIQIAVVGCTGKLGRDITKTILSRRDVRLKYAIARKGNPFVGHRVSEMIGGNEEIEIIDDIELAGDCDVFVDCTNAGTFIQNSLAKYKKMKKSVVIATTGFEEEAVEKIRSMAKELPVFMSGNFSAALYHFLETLKFAVKRIADDTEIQIIEYHHNQKMDAPSGTALMIRDALAEANERLTPEKISIHSVRGGTIPGKHEVIFGSGRDEVVTFSHQVLSRGTFAQGAVDIAVWITKRVNGLYDMRDFCGNNPNQIP